MIYRIDNIPNRSGKPSVLLRRHWREGTRIRKETIANLTRHPGWLVEGLRSLIDAGTGCADSPGPVEIRRSLPHGHAAAILGTLKSLGFERILARADSLNRPLALAAIAARVADPLSKLGTSRLLSEDTASSSLGAMLGLARCPGTRFSACWTGCWSASPGLSGASRTQGDCIRTSFASYCSAKRRRQLLQTEQRGRQWKNSVNLDASENLLRFG